MKRLLNLCCGGDQDIDVEGYEQVTLDIDPKFNPQICMDARELTTLEERFDFVYCSHALEHFHWHEISVILQGIHHVLNSKGTVLIRVPNLLKCLHEIVENKLPLDGVYYTSKVGPITPLDVIFGYQNEIKSSGKEYYAHKIGFSEELMYKFLLCTGFKNVNIQLVEDEIHAIGFKL